MSHLVAPQSISSLHFSFAWVFLRDRLYGPAGFLLSRTAPWFYVKVDHETFDISVSSISLVSAYCAIFLPFLCSIEN